MSPPAGRDRDPVGRPRNARPRDGLGRPLPKVAAGEPRVPDDLVLPPDESLDLADQMLTSGRPFHAHEVLEASWKSAPAGERDFWQGLAQLAVGLTHARRGNARGAVALLSRGAARIRPYSAADPHGVPVAAVIAAAEELCDQIERDGLAMIPAKSLRLRLTRRALLVAATPQTASWPHIATPRSNAHTPRHSPGLLRAPDPIGSVRNPDRPGSAGLIL